MASRSHTSEASPGAGRRYPGIYLGVVSSTADPRQLGRVKVRVAEIGGQTDLAWARVLSPMGGSGLGAPVIPGAGALVHVAFEAEDVNRPVVLGAGWSQNGEKSTIPLAALGDTDTIRSARGQDTASGAAGVTLEEPADPFAAQYPNNVAFKTKAGHLLEIDSTQGAERISITHAPSQSWLEFHPDGTLVVGVKGKRYFLVDDDAEEHVKGDHHVVTDGKATYKSGQKFSRTARGYKLLSTGKVEIEASGDFSLTAQKGKADIAGDLELKALGTTKIGPGLAPGNVVTTLTHPVDYISGIPIQGTPSVQAG